MGQSRGVTRREFLAKGAAVAAAGLALPPATRAAQFLEAFKPITGSIVGAGFPWGHRLRSRGFPPPSKRERHRVVIVGAGISGLAAGWTLLRGGETDFVLLELESEAGGNARFGESEGIRFPWAAHYLPLPDRTQKGLCAFLEEAGIITGWAPSGAPRFEEKYLCFAPQERLFVHGRWQEDLWPPLGATAEDLRQYRDWKALLLDYKRRVGRDGKKAFSIPVDESSTDPLFRDLDRISMAEWLDRQGWDSPALRWYVEYACRDDYGLSLESTSAWAGIHYWAARPNAFTKEEDVVLTWPEGNGFLAKRLRDGLGDRVRTRCLAFGVKNTSRGAAVAYLDEISGCSAAIEADAVILACPQFVSRRIFRPWRLVPPAHLTAFSYAPWIVANLWIEGEPVSHGAEMAWDNVIQDSSSLGYVVATHQSLETRISKTIWTYYHPFPNGKPEDQRQWMIRKSWEEWKDLILSDLRRCHPDIDRHVRRIDVMLWGHGMIRPVPGFMWGAERHSASRRVGQVHFAHSDLSGLSIFEEAFWRGQKAASEVLVFARTR